MLTALAACSDYDDVSIKIEAPADQMHIASTSEDLVLLADTPNDDAVTFSWGDATDRGPTATLTYLYRIAPSDQINDAEYKVVTEHSVTYTHDDLNDMLQDWGISPETQCEITAEVIASVDDETKFQKPEKTTITILVTGFRPVSRPLYIVNPAQDYGANPFMAGRLTNGTRMDELVLGKQYRYTGWFEAAKGVKCVYDEATGFPAINKGEGDLDLAIRKDASDPENLFHVPYDGYWIVTVNTKTMTLSACHPSPWDHVYMVGNAMPCGWDINNPVEFKQMAENPAVFYYEGWVNGDNAEMKAYHETGNWGADAFMALIHGSDWNGDDNIDYVYGANPDKKWIISRAGNYRIEMDMYFMKIKFIPLD